MFSRRSAEALYVTEGSRSTDKAHADIAAAPLRRSCQFCRSRKIRCSGQSVCNACQERNLDCVYSTEAGKGRPKGSVSKSSSRHPSAKSSLSSSARSEAILRHAADEGSHSLSNPVNMTQIMQAEVGYEDHGHQSQRINTVADELSRMFDENFTIDSASNTNVYQNALAIFNRRLDQDPAAVMHTLVGISADLLDDRNVISYDGLLCFMTQELVEMLSVRFSNLGSHNFDDTRRRFYVRSLARDRTPTMFKPVLPESSPLDELDSHRILQMIEVWFSVHPLSTVISKTLLLRDFRDGTHDTTLLSVILADASHAQSGQAALVDEDALFNFAVTQLHQRSSSNWDISTAQALLLFGWHELCIGHARRATCFIGYAGRIATKLNIDLSKNKVTGQGQINGVDIGAVEADLVQNIYWMSFAITLWSFMQMDQPFSFLLPKNIPTAFPSMDESSSALTKLDVASNNISTLQSQTRMLRELWPLSHITSTIAHIYALYPRSHDAGEAPLSVSWQNRPIHQLRQLLNVHQEVSALCIKVRRVLLDAIKFLDNEDKAPSSKTVIVIAYHTIIIHMLFPRQEVDTQVVVTESLLDGFRASVTALIGIGSTIEATQSTSNLLVSDLRPLADTETFALGLEVCGRAISYMYKRAVEGSVAEHEVFSHHCQDLANFAAQMHKLIQGEILRKAKRFQAVKRTLKQAKLSLQRFGVPPFEASGSSSRPSLSYDDFNAPSHGSDDSRFVPTPPQSFANDPLSVDFLANNTALLDPMTNDGFFSADPRPIDWFQLSSMSQMQDGMLNMPKPYTTTNPRYTDSLPAGKTSVRPSPATVAPANSTFYPPVPGPHYHPTSASGAV